MAVRCPIHTDEVYEGESTRKEHRLHPERGCRRCIVEQDAANTMDPAAAIQAAKERQQAARANALSAARKAAEAKGEAEKHLREAEAAEKEAAALIASLAPAAT